MSKLDEILERGLWDNIMDSGTKNKVKALFFGLTDEAYELAYAKGDDEMYAALVQLREKINEL